MKHTFLQLLFILLCSKVCAQPVQKPEWVKQFQQGKIFNDTIDSYRGVGSSALTQEDADAKARQDFCLSVEVRVQYEIARNIQEVDNVTHDEYSSSAKMSSDIVLRGITMSERFEDKDEKKFYALIRIQKSAFDTLLVTEIRRDLERKKAENMVNEDKRREELRRQQVVLELKKKEEELRTQQLELEKQEYEDFLKLKAPDQVVDLRNGEIARTGCVLAAKMRLSSFSVQSAYFILALSHFELLTHVDFRPGDLLQTDFLLREEVTLKVQLLNHAGEFYRTSLAFGVVGYSNASTLRAFDTLKPKISLFLAGNVALPNVLSSYASLYIDGRKTSAGLNSFPFPGNFKDAVSLVFQVDYIWNKEWRNRFLDPLLIQTGIRFRASDAFATSFTYENNEFFVFSLELGL